MPNEILWLICALVNFVLFIAVYKGFGLTGIFAWIAVGTVLANIQVTKNIEIFGITATLGNVMYGTIFLATDALNELYGKSKARQAVFLGFFVMLATLAVMQLSLGFIPAGSDTVQSSLEIIFGFLPRIILGSFTAFIISQLFDIHVYQKIKQRMPDDKWLFLRNNGSTMVSQLLDSLIFVPIAFLGVYDFTVVMEIFITTYLVKVIVAMLDTPFLYLIKHIKPFGFKHEQSIR